MSSRSTRTSSRSTEAEQGSEIAAYWSPPSRSRRHRSEGELAHEGLLAMAAAYLFHIVKNHPFVDGNKRTGLLAAIVFLVPDRFDDEGIRGATTKRPGLEKLLRRIEDGKIQRVIVYRLDRRTRRLADWARLADVFDRHGVGLTVVHGAIDAEAGSLARFQLNMLASYGGSSRQRRPASRRPRSRSPRTPAGFRTRAVRQARGHRGRCSASSRIPSTSHGAPTGRPPRTRASSRRTLPRRRRRSSRAVAAESPRNAQRRSTT